MVISEEQIEKCLADGGGRCPYCGKHDVEYLRIEEDSEGTIELARCKTCGMKFREVRVLTLSEIWEAEEDEVEEDDVPLDGDAASALASAGFGTDEDYGG